MLADRVLHTTTTTGLSDYQLVDPTDPLYLSAVSSVSTGGSLVYLAVMGSVWEICTGTVTAGSPATLTRVLIRSSTGALINWGAGTKTIRSIGQADVIRFGARGLVPTAGGTANAQTVAHLSPLRALRSGMEVQFLPTTNTAAATLNVDGTGAIAVVRPDGTACVGGELRSATLARAVYDGTSWRLTTLPAAPLPTNSAGIGQKVAIASPSDGAIVTAPAGGTWACDVLGFTSSGGGTNFQLVSGVYAGGANIISAPGVTFLGFATRIA